MPRYPICAVDSHSKLEQVSDIENTLFAFLYAVLGEYIQSVLSIGRLNIFLTWAKEMNSLKIRCFNMYSGTYIFVCK